MKTLATQKTGAAGVAEAAERPTKSITLWRGATDEYKDGWAWTDDREVAEGFAHSMKARRLQGTLWTAVVEPWRLLAYLDGRDFGVMIKRSGK